MIKLACTHCRHQFELQSIAGAVCPSCGWSSSVIPASELNISSDQKNQKSTPSSSGWISGFLIFSAKICGAGFVVIVGVMLLFRLASGWVRPQDHSVSSKKSFLSGFFPGAKNNNRSDVMVRVDQTDLKPRSVTLTADEMAALHSVLSVPDLYELTDGERKMLEQAQNLMAGDMERLPSGPWSIAQYQEFIKNQEQIFHMPLARSYKKNLEELFAKTYASAYDHFLAGRILAARDAYVAALGFPVYGNDVRKHRAVVLTMLRGFINDVLAKIGAMNFTLARQGSAGLTQQISSSYAALQQQIRANAYGDALSSIEKLESLLSQSAATSSVLAAPTYGKALGAVDGDIQVTLMRILQVPAFGFDTVALLSDLAGKKALILKLTDENRKKSVENYAQAVEKIKTAAWGDAKNLLKDVTTPENLKQDADQKIELIEKMTAGLKG